MRFPRLLKKKKKKSSLKTKLSQKHFKEAKQYLVGGVNSPVRAFGAVGGTPLFIKKAKEAILIDEDGNSLIDFVCSWGPLILGHCHPAVVRAIQNTAQLGTSFGAPTQAETVFAKEIQKAFPSMEKIRLVSSGTEATQSAIRLARGATQREIIVKFEGCYHGHSDALLVKAGSGGATFGIPTSQGISQALAQYTFVLPYNDTNAVERLFQSRGKQIAAIILEPIAANMGVILPKKEFLQTIRKCCDKYQTVLIFDEVISGFRVSYGGAQSSYQIRPDLTCLGKIIGGGLPIGAYGGASDLMKHISPEGPVYQAGTLSGNPLAVSAGLATLKELSKKSSYQELSEKTKYFCTKLENAVLKLKAPVQLNWVTGMFTLFFSKNSITDFKSANQSDTQAYAKFFHFLLEKGIYFPPSQFEACMISLAHTQKQLDTALKHITDYLKHEFK